ncbi:MAG TPA: SIR2 family protein [Pirellulaceae bacterium]|nr:SIR2 family protein [Pirellulaceae bacterium]HMO93564.1 SIR2 family protein [Pirellulaceae bacterium]HMP71113.1 SIR2 family protein [Pirellulaceae bacterium]
MEPASAHSGQAFGPSNATLSDAIGHLRNNFAAEVEAILAGQYACWLGSGISRTRFPGLDLLVQRLLKKIYRHIDKEDERCPWRKCLNDILDLARCDIASVSPAIEAENWDSISSTIGLLVDRYSDVLDFQVNDGVRVHSMAWDILHLDKIYGNNEVAADSDHTLLALLLAEGAFYELVTTNWDALVEQSHFDVCASGCHNLSVVVEAADIPGSREAKARIIKVHGCARRCLDDQSKRSQMVATRTQIQQWERGPGREGIKDLLRTVIRERPFIFIGLSGQDWNLQSEILAACLDCKGPLPGISRVLFAEPELRQAQRTVIKYVFGDSAYENDRIAIEGKATLKLFAKPLLGALYVIALRKKLDTLADASFEELSPEWQAFVRDFIQQLENSLTAHFDSLRNPDDDAVLWRQFVELLPPFVARCSRLFLKYDIPKSMKEYHPFFPRSYRELSDRLSTEDNSAMTWFLFAVASIYAGVREGLWLIRSTVGKEGCFGQFELVLHGHELSVFIVPDGGSGRARLLNREFILADGSRKATVIYAIGNRPTSLSHSPAHSLPYTPPQEGPVEIWIQDLAKMYPDQASLLDGLKHELVCT